MGGKKYFQLAMITFRAGQFQAVRLLGEGGMGRVWQVIDRENEKVVALKTVRRLDRDATRQFKSEFRAAQGLHHRNLVRLHELFEDDSSLFFTMELVAGGCSFLDYVRCGHIGEAQNTSTVVPAKGLRNGAPSRAQISSEVAAAKLDLNRLRAVLPQAFAAIRFLHEAGVIHRDLKSSNILVTQDGEVKVVDFGIALAAGDVSTDEILGTAIYMSPEQCQGMAVGPASDWYSLGVLLFAALTGRYPFEGSDGEVTKNKVLYPAPNPQSFVSGVPEDLCALTEQLLRRDAAERLGALLIHQRNTLSLRPHTDSPAPSSRPALVGRHGELQWLDARLSETRGGTCVVARIYGESGIGKTALVQSFLRQAEDKGIWTFQGRCYERESIHYKGLDGVVEAIVARLSALSALERTSLLPPNFGDAVRQFPSFEVLLDDSGEKPVVLDSRDDAIVARRKSVDAFANLLATMAKRFTVIIHIDDVQWIDSDGEALLEELLGHPSSPALLCVLTVMTAASADFVRDNNTMVMRGLSVSESHQLAKQVATASGFQIDEDRASLIAGDAGGHPILLCELARQIWSGGYSDQGGMPRILELYHERMCQLDSKDRTILQIAALGDTPMTKHMLAAASALPPGDVSDSLERLTAERFIVGSTYGQSGKVQTGHEWVRKAALKTVSSTQKVDLHRAIALSLENLSPHDVEALAMHWSSAGDMRRASSFAESAASAASRSFAFERAAKLLRLALAGAEDPTRQTRILSALGQALGASGRSAESADAFAKSAALQNEEHERQDLNRLAADQWLAAGHIDQGIELLRKVLVPMGAGIARTPWLAMVTLLINRFRLYLRGLHFELRSIEDIAPSEIQRVDIAWSVASGLSLVDMIRGVSFQTRCLLLALKAGEPLRLCRSLSMEGAVIAGEGAKRGARAEQIFALAERLAEASGQTNARAWLLLSRAVASMQQGNFPASLADARDAEDLFREPRSREFWQLAKAQSFVSWNLAYMGRFQELSERTGQLIRDYNERGDLLAQLNVKAGPLHMLSLAQDDPERMRKECEEALASWSQQGFHFQHMSALFTLAAYEMYEGKVDEAMSRINSQWPAIRASMLLRVNFFRKEFWFLRSRAALRCILDSKEHATAALKLAKEGIRQLRRDPVPWSMAMALVIKAGVARFEADQVTCRQALGEAETLFSAAQMKAHAAACAFQFGRVFGEARPLADSFMKDQGVRRPEKFSQLLVPVRATRELA